MYNMQVSSQNTSEDYSEDEVIIGTWINGKPIYRKVITGTIATDTVIDSNADDLIAQGGEIIDTYNTKFPFPRVYGTNEIQFRYTGGALKFIAADSSITVSSYKVWVEYTKTTD